MAPATKLLLHLSEVKRRVICALLLTGQLHRPSVFPHVACSPCRPGAIIATQDVIKVSPGP